MLLKPVRLLGAAVCAAVFFCSAALADQINVDSDNLAIQGYDPVAYFTQSRPVEGVPEFRTEWQDVIWQFASAEHQSMFEQSPEKYAPRYGGFCAGAMASKGVKDVIHPENWVIVDGNLFLAGQPPEGFLTEENTEALISQADKNWEALN